MLRFGRLPPILLLLLGCCAGPVLAQSNIGLRVVKQQELRVRTEGGGSDYRLVPASAVNAGDEVLYTIFFKNNGDLPATDIVIDNPIPSGTRLKGGSVFGAGTDVLYSIDQGRAFAHSAELGVIENGQPRQAKPEEYTHIRWVFRQTLLPGHEGMVGFRAVIR